MNLLMIWRTRRDSRQLRRTNTELKCRLHRRGIWMARTGDKVHLIRYGEEKRQY